MAASIHDLGSETRILVVDDFMDEVDLLREQAAAMAPFTPEVDTYYPGLRRMIHEDDATTYRHVSEGMAALLPLMTQAYGVERLRPIEACFCLVTKRPEEVGIGQHVPHYDSADPRYFAFLHYLNREPQGGTGFYRHRASGFERLNPAREAAYSSVRDRELAQYGPPPVGYISDSTDQFERTGFFEAKYNRLLVYQGSVLHSGHIPSDFAYSDNPLAGRLTLNIFAVAE